MNRKKIASVVGTAALLAAGLAATGGAVSASAASTTTVPAGAAGFAPGCTAQFVRSASGLINETNRNCSSTFQGVTGAVLLQFRPTSGTKIPNPNCDSNVVVAPFTFTNHESSLDAYFLSGQEYNVCVYLVNNSSTGTVDSHDPAGTTIAQLPVAGGRYRIDVRGTWNNTSHGLVDAEYTNGDDGGTWDANLTQQGWPGLGEAFGDLLVNGAAVNWGAQQDVTHAYSTQISGSSLNLTIFDGDASTGLVQNAGWYDDNVGSLNYTVTYLGL